MNEPKMIKKIEFISKNDIIAAITAQFDIGGLELTDVKFDIKTTKIGDHKDVYEIHDVSGATVEFLDQE